MRPYDATLCWATNSYRVNKCVTVSRMLSGRFRCGSLLRHFDQQVSGLCQLCGEELEDLPHIILPRCPHLIEKAKLLTKFAFEAFFESHAATKIFYNILNSEDDDKKVQFFLDPTVIPEIIAASQEQNLINLFLGVTTTWCYSLNRERVKLMGK